MLCICPSWDFVSWVVVITAPFEDKLTGDVRAWAGCEHRLTPCGLAAVPSRAVRSFVP